MDTGKIDDIYMGGSEPQKNGSTAYNAGAQTGGAYYGAPQGAQPDGAYYGAPQGNCPPKPPVKQKRRMPFWAGLLIGIFATLAACVAFIVVIANNFDTDDDSPAYEAKLEKIIYLIENYYIGEISEEDIADGAADGVVSMLDDKYAAYYDKEAWADLLEDSSGTYAGIGISIVMNDDNEVEVYKVFKNSPAEQAGIQVKDIITGAGGQTGFEDLESLVSVVRGEIGTSVDVTYRRGGAEYTVTVVRASIVNETVEYEMVENNIGYILVSEFNSNTCLLFRNAITDLLSQGMESLIIDLRDNPGGDYDTVVSMADRILPEGVIVSVKDKYGVVETSNSDSECLDIPIVVLVNGNSASASELFTMALQDYGVAEIVGTQTFGKGIVQSLYQLGDGTGVKFTTARYYGPNGVCIQDTGITPDYVVEIPDEAYEDGTLTREEDTQYQKALELLK